MKMVRHNNHDVKYVTVAHYFANKDEFDKTDNEYLLDNDRWLIYHGKIIGYWDGGQVLERNMSLDTVYRTQMEIYRSLQKQKEEANSWIIDEMHKITPEHYVRTFFTCAQMRREDKVIRAVVPVDVYEVGNIGYEIIAIAALAKHCPWDMNETFVTIDTGNTKVKDLKLMDMVVDDQKWVEVK